MQKNVWTPYPKVCGKYNPLSSPTPCTPIKSKQAFPTPSPNPYNSTPTHNPNTFTAPVPSKSSQTYVDALSFDTSDLDNISENPHLNSST